MSTQPSHPADDSDELLFIDDNSTATGQAHWKILIADDEPDVHATTKLVLRDFSFQGRGVEFLDAYSGEEACTILKEQPDIAVVFLDVVMTTDDDGLRAVKRIREELGNTFVRIILRTGQPGQAPEECVVIDYDINDYRSKAELTSRQLRTSLTSALRSFSDLQTIETHRRGLQKVLDASSDMDFRSRNLFVSGLLTQLGSLLDANETDMLLARRGAGTEPSRVIAACGLYEPFIGEALADVIDPDDAEHAQRVFGNGGSDCTPQRSMVLLALPELADVLLYLRGSHRLGEAELALVSIFCKKIVIACDNYETVEHTRFDLESCVSLLAAMARHSFDDPAEQARNIGRLSRDIAHGLAEMLPRGSIESRLPDTIAKAAMLADIGMISVAPGLLQIPGPLSDEARDEMKKHTLAGAAFIDSALRGLHGGLVLRTARQIALSHHERFDGTGYPQQLRATDIPLAARIVAVADSYMALTSDRPWRKAFGHEDAVDLIVQQSDLAFDPDVVSAFLKVCDAHRPSDVALSG